MRVLATFLLAAVLPLCLAALGSGAPPKTSSGDDTASHSASDHWSFRPLNRPEPPALADRSRLRNPIDAFVVAKLEAAGLTPLPPADRVTLIRRVTFDLTGLPPTPDEVAAFVRDESPDAYEKLIGRLLDSPAYGERWAQHWLDLARFAETDGFEHDLVRPNAWRYRDWVIDALNADMPYDEFVRMQIAGDEWESRGDAETRRRGEQPAAAVSASGRLRVSASFPIATGFLLCGPDMPDINSQDERRHVVLNEMTATVGSVFLGVQLECAQCHDHKSDPITMADFYSLRAFFEPAEFFDEAPLASPEELAVRERLEAPIKAERERIEKELKQFDATAHERLNKDPQVKLSRDELLSALSETEREEFQKLTDDLKLLSDSKLPPLPMGRVLRERAGTVRPSHIMIRGDFRQPGPEVTPAFPRVVNPWGEEIPPSPFRGRHGDTETPRRGEEPAVAVSASPRLRPSASSLQSSGRRTALARWLTRPDHSLATRVIVNRLWQHHFGEGLVRTPSDFGTMGERPSHPELLDWLATQFTRPVEDGGCGWNLKRMHKLMLTSATYSQASRPSEPGWTSDQRAAALASWRQSCEIDPENRLLARMNRQRLDGETMRDAMLAAGDRLSPRRGGPGVRPPLPDELVATLLKGQWPVSPDEEDHRRRSIYLFVRRNLRYPLFDVFDRPDTNASCPRRSRSTTAPQALELFNSEIALVAARDLAGLILTRAGAEPADQIDLCFARVLSRRPTAAELASCTDFLQRQTARLSREARLPGELALPTATMPAGTDRYAAAALTDICLAIFNLSEFLYVD